MKKLFSVLSIVILVASCYAQKHDSNWLIGGTCAISDEHLISRLDFSDIDNSPELLPHIRFFFTDTNSSISDEDGVLQFYTNGNDVFNWKHELMQNGENLADLGECNEQNLKQGAISIPYPGREDQYVLITINEDFFLLNEEVAVFQEVYFNHVDMTKNSGEGELMVRQDLIIADTLNAGQGVVCQHANGRDWWLLMFEFDSNEYYRFLIDPSGVIAKGKGIVDLPVFAGRNQAVYSPDGNFLAHFNATTVDEGIYIDIFSFDRCSGSLSNQTQILFNNQQQSGTGGVAFSPNSRFLYVTNSIVAYQYDLWSSDLIDSRITIAEYDGFLENNFWRSTFHTLQLAPNNKIYVTNGSDGHFLHVIHNPNLKGLDCNFEQRGLVWPTWTHGSIPNFPHYRMGPLEGSLCDTLGEIDAPFANFVISELENSREFFFDDQSTSNVETWFWDFGDGNSSAEQSPTHTYVQNGVYEICLRVTNQAGSNTKCQSLCLLPEANAIELISASSLVLDCSTENQEIELFTPFDDLNFARPENWIVTWEGPENFMEIGSSEISIFQGGTYFVTIEHNTFTCKLTDSLQITEGNLSLEFSLSQDSVLLLSCGDFVDIDLFVDAACFEVRWERSNGDGATTFNTTRFSFATAGEYTFTVRDCNDNCEAVRNLVIGRIPLSPLWEATITGRTASFSPAQTGVNLFHIWDFGDNNFSADSNPIHTYADVGTYIVEHEILDGCESYCYSEEIVIIEDVGSAPAAGFSYERQGSTMAYSFEDNSTGVVETWSWNFGDGNSSADPSSSHEYSQYGTYEVCLTVANIMGSDTYCETVCVLPSGLVADLIQASDTVLDCTNTEEGIVLSTSVVLSEFFNSEDWHFVWTYPSGELVALEEVIINEAGNYVLELMDTTSSCSILSSINISENFEVPIFTIATSADTIVCDASFELYLLDVDTACSEVIVYQGELPILSTTQDTIVIEGAGEYSVEVTDCISGCSSTQEFSIQVEVISAAWTFEDMGANISFAANQTNNVDHFWDFGDGDTSEEENPTHIYSASGSYAVTHIVSNACGSDTLVQVVEVIITSSHSLADEGLEVFPNPASKVLHISSTKKGISGLRLYSSVGELLVDKRIHGVGAQFPIENFAPGVYWLHIELSDGDVFLEKVLIVR